MEFWHSSATLRWLCRQPEPKPRIDMLHHRAQSTTASDPSGGLKQADGLLLLHRPELFVSSRRLRQVDTIRLVRQKREENVQNLGFSSRPFVVCGLPVKRPPKGCR